MTGDPAEGSIVPRYLSNKQTPEATKQFDNVSVEAGPDDLPTVRPFVITKGRTEAQSTFAPETQLVAIGDPARFSFELRALLELLHTPLSIAEVSANMKLPIQAVSVLASDLRDAGAIQTSSAASVHDSQMIRRLIDVVREI